MASAGPIRSHSTKTSEAAWNGNANETRLGDAGAATMRRAFAWVDPEGDPDNKGSYKFIHHEVTKDGKVGPANMRACISGIGVLNGGRRGARIPSRDRKRIYDHLAKHLRDADHEPPALE
ncbi:MAG: hypothetical protein J2P43_13090 [Candidatus Dormibacteraeota bacterium]|nr:hypothetical protein [Candidatus Dormibacteraeota bacterium]